MPNQYTSLTRENVIRKMNRKKNPVQSVAQMAREFGYDTSYYRWTPGQYHGSAAPKSFRTKLKGLIGEELYNELRQSKSVSR